MYIDDSNVTYFDSLAVEHISKEIKTFVVNKNITINIYKVQAYDSIMQGYFYIGLIDFRLKGKSLYKFIFTSWLWKEWQNKIKTFSIESKSVKMYCNVLNKCRKLKKNKLSYIF